MSSHREAPAISMDPVADNTDTYAFVTPNDRVTLITNYLPAQVPAGGPNFYEFAEDVRYEIHVDNDGDGLPNVTYRFRFETEVINPDTFLYNTGPIESLDSANWNRRQHYSVIRIDDRGETVLADRLSTPPCHIGPRSTPDYVGLANSAVHRLGRGRRVFAGQRADAFFVDLGSVFDLGTLRPFQSLHLVPGTDEGGHDTLATANVHTIALEVPIRDLTRNRSVPRDPLAAESVIGVWGATSRRKAFVRDTGNGETRLGPWVQVSRLGNPLFNEVIVPMGRKDDWNARPPAGDRDFASHVARPELARLLPALYPDAFPNLASLDADRADLLAILLTGIPEGVVDGFQNHTGDVQADELRLNVAVPPSSAPNPLGLVGGDPAGFPNGRRPIDDVVTIELRAIAGLTYALVEPSYSPDQAASLIQDGTAANPGRRLLGDFPYMGLPHSGYEVP